MNTLFKRQGRNYRNVFLALAVLINLIGAPMLAQPALATGTNCVTSSPSGDNTYTITLCIDAPADGATITGVQTISATPTPAGATPGVAKLIFSMGTSTQPAEYLLTDYQTPYTFTLPSNKFVDGTYALEVVALNEGRAYFGPLLNHNNIEQRRNDTAGPPEYFCFHKWYYTSRRATIHARCRR